MTFRPFDSYLDRVAQARTQEYIRDYATHNNVVDARLAGHIELEVQRRLQMGKELDIYEPIRWTGAQTTLSVAIGLGIKAFSKKEISYPALVALTTTTALSNSIQLIRLVPRFKAGLKGGLDVALAMDAIDGKTQPWQLRVASERDTARERARA